LSEFKRIDAAAAAKVIIYLLSSYIISSQKIPDKTDIFSLILSLIVPNFLIFAQIPIQLVR
jgi:hypothetical protein